MFGWWRYFRLLSVSLLAMVADMGVPDMSYHCHDDKEDDHRHTHNWQYYGKCDLCRVTICLLSPHLLLLLFSHTYYLCQSTCDTLPVVQFTSKQTATAVVVFTLNAKLNPAGIADVGVIVRDVSRRLHTACYTLSIFSVRFLWRGPWCSLSWGVTS